MLAVLAIRISISLMLIPDSTDFQSSETATFLEQAIAGRAMTGIGGGGMVAMVSVITKGGCGARIGGSLKLSGIICKQTCQLMAGLLSYEAKWT